MAETTEISWAHSTFNPWQGCTKVSPGCDHCYAETLSKRWGHDRWGTGKTRDRTSDGNWEKPLAWNRKAAESGQPWRVFCASMADVFDNEVEPTWRMELFDLIRRTPALTWMLLTKRIGNAEEMLPGGWYAGGESPCGPYPNVWIGATVVNQEEAERDIPKLLRVPAAVRWLSCEPLLEPLDLTQFMDRGTEHMGHYEFPRVDWVIVGGESGHHARHMNAHWAREIRDQCAAAGVPFHFKQWGEHNENGLRVGKKAAGHLLDGIEHRAFP